MLDLSGRGDEDVKQICSTALNQLPPDMVQLDDKMVKVLVSLLSATGNSVVGDGGNTVSEPSVHDLKPWSLRSASIAENPVDVQPSWINYVCQDFEVSTSRASSWWWRLVRLRRLKTLPEPTLRGTRLHCVSTPTSRVAPG